MRAIVDESTGSTVARWLNGQGHDAVSIYDEAPRLPDKSILELALRENRVAITNDKDFGDLVFRDRQPHCGVILLRPSHPNAAQNIAALERLLADLPDDLSACFVVVTDTTIRITRSSE